MAVRFDADGEDYTRALALGTQAALTVTCWLKISVNRATWSTPWSIDNGTGDNWLIQTSGDGVTLGTVFDATSQQNMGALTVGTWYFVALAMNGSNGFLYHKTATAASMSTVTVDGGTASVNAATFRIGESPWGGEWWNGCVSAVKVWTAQLSAAEVANEAAQYQPHRVANLAAYYPLVRPETTDYSGNARTLSGGTGATREDGPPVPWRISSPRLILPAAAAGGTVALDAVCAAAADTAGAASVGRGLAGTNSTSAQATGSAAVARPLSGASTGAADASGGLAAVRPVAGVSSAAAGAAGQLAATRGLVADATSAADLVGDLTISGQVTLGADLNSAADTQADLAAARPVAGSLISAASLTAALDRRPALGSSTAAVGHLAGTAEVVRGLSGSVLGAADLVGHLTVNRPVAGTSHAAATATGDLVTSPLITRGGSALLDRRAVAAAETPRSAASAAPLTRIAPSARGGT